MPTRPKLKRPASRATGTPPPPSKRSRLSPKRPSGSNLTLDDFDSPEEHGSDDEISIGLNSLRTDDIDDQDEDRDHREIRLVSPLTARTPSSGFDSGANGFNFSFTASSEQAALKPDHQNRPLFVRLHGTSEIVVLLETFHPLADLSIDFLEAIATPLNRPVHLHEYRVTQFSIQTAISSGLTSSDVIDILDKFSKLEIDQRTKELIKGWGDSWGRVRAVTREGKCWVDCKDAEIAALLLSHEMIRSSRIGDVVQGGWSWGIKSLDGSNEDALKDVSTPLSYLESVFSGETSPWTSFEIRPDALGLIKQSCANLGFPILEDYDFRNDPSSPGLDIDIKPGTTIRRYQEMSLSRIFGNNRARSGNIVLPPGAGKTLVGIMAACTIRKSCVVLCTNATSVAQWKEQFLQWSTLKPSQIGTFTSEEKLKFRASSGVLITTYAMVANRQKRSLASQEMMDFISSHDWGLVLFDEVHVVPAAIFRKTVTSIRAKTKLGLTATFVREDDKIDDLNHLIGPKLYESSWTDLTKKGYIANVQCVEVCCEMAPIFYREYLRQGRDVNEKTLLHTMNPNKFQACQFLIQYHEARGDKIIVFSDNLFALELYAKRLGKPFLHGGTAQSERMYFLNAFKLSASINTIFLSKIGDTSLDIPEATVVIQISSHFGSRRQEAQRLGRVLRARRRHEEGFNAYFYTLVSRDTQEMYFSAKRQQFLTDQGYAFRIVTALDGMESAPNLLYRTPQEQNALLREVLEVGKAAAGTAAAGTS